MPARPRHLHFKIPGKTFLLGEYVAMFGGPCLLAATKPSFELSFSAQTEGNMSFHSQSPAGQWLEKKSSDFKDTKISFKDPYSEKGGFGASTAQFLGTYLYSFMQHNISEEAFQNSSFVFECWQAYKNLFKGQSVQPSGADLVSQIVGEICFFHANEQKLTIQAWPFKNLDVLFLKTPHKIATHEHLQNISKEQLPLEQLEKIALRTIASFEKVKSDDFLFGIKEYAELLAESDLLCKESEQLITELAPIPGVKLIKGCGALGADVLALFVEAEKSQTIQNNLAHYEFVISLQESISPGICVEVES